ncbi:oxidoreductase [Biostraticola tofi]|uniref:Short-subunit dehydrogenase n=1 Tax=Biostraticola tofi TaxID=466109 RepID=A0A4V2W5L1_9GAMM|nr:oxidoreductase [Biostraticola tofi]TCW00276.1 short-subunit dehydrogenase [Biostraticola tofi]
MTQSHKPVWFITGCSTGFGRELAIHTLSLGYPTVVTARNPDKIADIVAGHEDHALVLALDVTRQDQVEAALKAADDRFGGIDVLVNNAGVGYFGSFEESALDAVQRMFDINVWGLTAMTRAALPVMRRQRSGTIVNISSIGGITTFPALSFYHATKFAVEALSESLSQEVEPLGIKVLIVEPGPFRTDWAGRSADEAPQTIADYADTAHKRQNASRENSGRQPGDPVRAVQAIVKAVEAENPPLRLVLGNPAMDNAYKKIALLQRDFNAWEEVSRGADFPEGQ